MFRSVQRSPQSAVAGSPDQDPPPRSPSRPDRGPGRSLSPFSHSPLRSARETTRQPRNDETPRLSPRSSSEPISLGDIGHARQSPPLDRTRDAHGNASPDGSDAAPRLPPLQWPPLQFDASSWRIDMHEGERSSMRHAHHGAHDTAGFAGNDTPPPLSSPTSNASAPTGGGTPVAPAAVEPTDPPRPLISIPPTATRQATPPQPPAPDAFHVPRPERQPGQAYDRSKPGFTLAETNGIRPLAPIFNAAAANHHGEIATGLAIGALGSGLAHETVGAGMNGHAMFASWRKRRRYDRQLSAMLDRDVATFRDAAVGSDARRLDRLILTRDHNGAFGYDLDKVMKLAADDSPELAQASAHAKDVLLTMYIRHEVAGKRMNRAAYELGRNALGIASGAALIAGTQGLAAAPAGAAAIATKQAGFALGLMNALDIGKGVRGLKQRMRNDKAREIDRNALTSRMTFDTSEIDDETPDEAIAAVHAVQKDNGRLEADRKLFGKIFPGRWINEKKSATNKNDMADLTAKHAMSIVERGIDRFAGEGNAKLHAFHEDIHAKDASTAQKKRALRDAIGKDADLVNAYHLMRDLGMRSGEARFAIESLIVRRIEIGLANDPAASHARATDAGRKYAERTASGECSPDDVTAMRTVLQRR
ncbi:putative type IIA topoisomerase [Burkholderia oklahomensis]|uniref:Type IIA topoisomerase n=2 Tax=Burkholderia oklahomensis TaxID=342113 RepID=A0AAI8BE79_9BURK|nr:hypothetical protein [Burkholderia oklahomensis]AIO70687.1 putative type IIA topoisomerase [Burkholderia oklahomensis]AOI38883.1 hypothetical protein WG70_04125 [Burkholderia oklahomensis EO147]KUY65586.1 hypothetical protein WG70_27570 [Burkholderia oklahomensis EO147]QPS40773.1 hypothetical protein I6G57_20920 [Burkholderia oklahomensis]